MATIKMQIIELMKKVENQNSGNKDIENEMIENLAKDCAEYISSIINMENSINLAKTRLDGNEYRELVTNFDKRRTDTHNVVISDVIVTNKVSVLYELPLIYTGDVNSRIEVAKFAKQYIDELFNGRRI